MFGRAHPRLLFVSYKRQFLISFFFFGEIGAKARVDFLSVALDKSQIVSEASAAYQEPVVNAMALVKGDPHGLE